MPFDGDKGQGRRSNFNETILRFLKAALRIGINVGLGALIDQLLGSNEPDVTKEPHDFFGDIEVTKIPDSDREERTQE